MSVGLVVVSHSARIAEGVVVLAGQMAPSVRIVAAGGTDDGGIGTSFDLVLAALAEADSGDGVVVVCDLGSAVLTAESALEFAESAARIRIADGPIVEGAVAAAVVAQAGDGLEAVLAAAQLEDAATADAAPTEAGGSGRAEAEVELVNAHGLHARPAAELVRIASGFDAAVTVDGVDAKSLLRVLGLGLGKGARPRFAAEGPEAQAAIDAIVARAAEGFGEE